MSPRWVDPQAEEARRALGDPWEGVEAAAVLGSGLSGGTGDLQARARAEYDQVPHLGACSVPGHPGRLLRGTLCGREILAFQGRRHLYEGISPAEAAFSVRLAAALGAKLLVLISAVGAVDPELGVGSWVLIEDHINLMGRNPLEGVRTESGPAFVDLTRTYRADLYEQLRDNLCARGVALRRGVLAAFPGPTYETPAEVRMARTLGAAVVGMSTVPEAVWGRFLGLEVLAFGRVANPAAGVAPGPLDHAEVVRQSARGGAQAAVVLEESLRAWGGRVRSEE